MSAADQLDLLERGEVTGQELRDTAIEACERLDPGLHFLVAPLFDRAPGGVPMLLKDAGQEIAGAPHYVGLSVLRDAGHRSTRTTSLAQRFEGAGFSIIGKAACPAFANGITTEPPRFEPTRNPWDRNRSAGGSSGGSAAAVAAGAVAVAHGSDATGSLRCPAALCGLVTLNPTAGRLPSIPPAGQPASDIWRDFVLARHAGDLEVVFERLTGRTIKAVERRLRVGVLDHDPELGLTVHPACRAGVHQLAKVLESSGHHVEPGWPAPLDHLWEPTFAAFGVLSDSTRPPMLDWVSRRLGRAVQPGEVEGPVFEEAARARARGPDEVTAAQRVVGTAIAPIHTWWTDHDLLVSPATFQPAWPLGGKPGPRELGTLAAPFSLTGQPALSVPVQTTGDGLPIGVQLVARRGDDEMLLNLATELERALNWTARRPPPTPLEP